jgi:hypothetical protein
MTRREVITKAITKQLSWVRAAEILGISARHMRRLRCKVDRWGEDKQNKTQKMLLSASSTGSKGHRQLSVLGASLLFPLK